MNQIILMATVWCTASWTPLVHQATVKEKQESQIHEMRLCPVQDSHAHMNERGEAGMGFSPSTTAHHFLIQAGGGVILVEAKDPEDKANRDNIRHHLAHIAQAFANADFDIPVLVHDTTPPGVFELKELKRKIAYSFQETPAGGQILIRTSDRRARAAIHKFLRYQIEEHQTGDPLEMQAIR
jgi:hypothetical protein